MKNLVKVTYWHFTPEQGYQYEAYFTHFRKAKALVRKQRKLGWKEEEGFGKQVISRTNQHSA